ncbi:MAG: hypothetical protein QM765_47355 [Myxococcales bacterium]
MLARFKRRLPCYTPQALPAPSAFFEGCMVRLVNEGEADSLVICLQRADDSWHWATVAKA